MFKGLGESENEVAQSCPTLCDPMDCSLPGSSMHGDSPGKNTGVSCHALLWGIFSTQGLNPGLPQCRQILSCLSHQGSPRILEWVAYPFSGRSSQPRNWTRVSYIAGRLFTSWATREAHSNESTFNVGDHGSIPGLGIATQVLLPGEFHRQRSLAGYSPWGRKEQWALSL